MDAYQIVAYCLYKQCRYHARVNAAGKSKKHLLISYLLLYSDELLLYESVSECAGRDTFHCLRSDVPHFYTSMKTR